jgi:multicomponent Na+:H+ antiporter subunit D
VAAFGLAGVSLVALPPSGGFIAKWLMLDVTIARGHWGLTAVIIGGGLLAAVYVMRVVGRLFQQVEAEQLPALKPIPHAMELSAFSLAVLAILLGFAGVYVLDLLEIGAQAAAGGGS